VPGFTAFPFTPGPHRAGTCLFCSSRGTWCALPQADAAGGGRKRAGCADPHAYGHRGPFGRNRRARRPDRGAQVSESGRVGHGKSISRDCKALLGSASSRCAVSASPDPNARLRPRRPRIVSDDPQRLRSTWQYAFVVDLQDSWRVQNRPVRCALRLRGGLRGESLCRNICFEHHEREARDSADDVNSSSSGTPDKQNRLKLRVDRLRTSGGGWLLKVNRREAPFRSTRAEASARISPCGCFVTSLRHHGHLLLGYIA
jgi:hypothetical protein